MSSFGVYEQTLFTCAECFIYKVPPLKTSSGHRAESWNLASPMFPSSSLKVVTVNDILKIQIFDSKPNVDGPPGSTVASKVAECPIDYRLVVSQGKNMEHYVESAADTSRYFVVRCEDAKTRRAVLIGVGFRERDHAVDFRSAISDYERGLKKEDAAKESARKHEEEEKERAEREKTEEEQGTTRERGNSGGKDLSIKEGEKIKINFKGLGIDTSKKQADRPKPSSGGLLPLRPPPPSLDDAAAQLAFDEMALMTVASREGGGGGKSGGGCDDPSPSGGKQKDKTVDGGADDDEWGDFASAGP